MRQKAIGKALIFLSLIPVGLTNGIECWKMIQVASEEVNQDTLKTDHIESPTYMVQYAVCIAAQTNELGKCSCYSSYKPVGIYWTTSFNVFGSAGKDTDTGYTVFRHFMNRLEGEDCQETTVDHSTK